MSDYAGPKMFGFGAVGLAGSIVSSSFGVIPSAGNEAAFTRFKERLACQMNSRSNH